MSRCEDAKLDSAMCEIRARWHVSGAIGLRAEFDFVQGRWYDSI